MQLTKQEIEHVAKLARLELTAEEIEKYGEQLSGVLSYIDQLREVDTSGIEPTAQITGLENSWREDVVEDWVDESRRAALKLAPDSDGDQLKVKRVLE